MSTVLRPNRKPIAVKNLGWLLRHWQGVQSLGFNYAPDSKRMIDGELIARMRDGTTYISEYASLSVCWNWLDRPVFRDLPFKLVWGQDFDHAKDFVIGDAQWKAINRMEYHAQHAAIFAQQ